MTIEEQIKILCVRFHISVAELARKVGQTPQNFNGKLKRQSFSISELEKIAEALDCKFEHVFVMPNGEKI
jgi:DNA-binding Xre family transcriptional regulator